MAEPFRASFLKIERAQQHLQELERVLASYLANNPIRWTTKITPDMEKKMSRVEWSFNHDAMPEVTSAILGDLFHNLRSALDLMASELCRDKEGSDEGVYFPFCMEEAELDGMIKRRHFDRAGPAAIKLLKELKPYKGGNTALRAIHDLNIQDKHQSLIISAVSSSGPIIDTRPEIGGPPVVVGDPNAASDIKLTGPLGSALAEQELVPTLHELVNLTAGIVEGFKALCAPAGKSPIVGDGG